MRDLIGDGDAVIDLGEVVERLGRSVADRLYRTAQAADDFTYGNQIAAFLRRLERSTLVDLVTVSSTPGAVRH